MRPQRSHIADGNLNITFELLLERVSVTPIILGDDNDKIGAIFEIITICTYTVLLERN